MILTPDEELNQTLNGNGEDKTVNKTETVTNTPAPPKEVLQPMQSDDFWGKAEIHSAAETTETGAEANKGAGNTGAAATETATEQKKAATEARISREALNTSARTAVDALNLAQCTILRPVMNWRFMKESEKRFGANLPRIQEMVMNDEVPTSPEEKSGKNRFLKFLNQRDEKVKQIPFNKDEEGDLELAFKSYFTLKNQSMSPEFLLYTALITILGKRAVDVFMWD